MLKISDQLQNMCSEFTMETSVIFIPRENTTIKMSLREFSQLFIPWICESIVYYSMKRQYGNLNV